MSQPTIGGLVRNFFLLVMAVVLTACSPDTSQTAAIQTQMMQCAKDTDCKGDRVCDAGACKSPTTQLTAIIQHGATGTPSAQEADQPAPGRADTNLQDALIAALRQKPGTSDRIGSSGDAIMAYVNAGYLTKKPDSRADYSDYRILKKPARFMGHTLVVIEEEYMQKYIGCCVSPGMAVTVRLGHSGDNLDAFATKNGCSLSRDSDDYYSAPDTGLPEAPKGTYATLSCKERDLKKKGE